MKWGRKNLSKGRLTLAARGKGKREQGKTEIETTKKKVVEKAEG